MIHKHAVFLFWTRDSYLVHLWEPENFFPFLIQRTQSWLIFFLILLYPTNADFKGIIKFLNGIVSM